MHNYIYKRISFLIDWNLGRNDVKMQYTFIVLKNFSPENSWLLKHFGWLGGSLRNIWACSLAVQVLKEGSVSVCSLCTQPLMGKARFQEKKEPCLPSFVHSPQGRVSRACPIDSLFPMGAWQCPINPRPVRQTHLYLFTWLFNLTAQNCDWGPTWTPSQPCTTATDSITQTLLFWKH